MDVPLDLVWYHFWSSALVGLLGLASMRLISWRYSSTAPDGSTSWISSRRVCLLLLLSVWTHIFADVIEHGFLPKIGSGLGGLIDALGSVV
ncbi:hypothetical protein ACFQMA_06450 [Halosimplex aquaticum]|uniref:LexA-binding, inner membrane-associated hydrolase n=1 Tax=Halosimplex aquaticum TaxID=3026162 RepID=A0ABD5Y533_9EURY|nr:hypothetical protein [Halosimplex aquaticum]